MHGLVTYMKHRYMDIDHVKNFHFKDCVLWYGGWWFCGSSTGVFKMAMFKVSQIRSASSGPHMELWSLSPTDPNPIIKLTGLLCFYD